MYDTLLVPVDGSDHSIRAAEHSVGLARRFDATVHLLNVVDIQAAAGPFDAGGVGGEFLAALEEQGQTVLDDVQAAVDDQGVDLQTAVSKGRPAEAILDYGAEHDAGLLAMGTHGRTGLDRYIIGSVTERVIRQSDRPVFTVHATDRNQFEDGYDDILVPTDGSEFASAAVDHAVAIAAQFDAHVHAVNVVDINAAAFSPSYTPPTEILEGLTSAGQEATEAVASAAREADLAATTEVRKGIPSDELLDYADEADVDLITMGTAGRAGLSRYLVGSTTERLLRRADVPVLAVTPTRQS
jgi:nucleotide-binding universal stress UspA family protein